MANRERGSMFDPHFQIRGQIRISEKETAKMAKEGCPGYYFQKRSSK